MTLPRPGPYMLLVDAYANLEGQPPNFQLKQDMEVSGAYKPEKTPPFQAKQVVDGYTFTVRGKPKVRALEPSTMVVQITDPQGKPAKLEPWFGALAHAIFFRTGSLDYFHTHVCGPNLPGCAGSGTGPIGTSTKPGELRAGILLPVSGKWRLFLQAKANGHTLSAPFTLNVG